MPFDGRGCGTAGRGCAPPHAQRSPSLRYQNAIIPTRHGLTSDASGTARQPWTFAPSTGNPRNGAGLCSLRAAATSHARAARLALHGSRRSAGSLPKRRSARWRGAAAGPARTCSVRATAMRRLKPANGSGNGPASRIDPATIFVARALHVRAGPATPRGPRETDAYPQLAAPLTEPGPGGFIAVRLPFVCADPGGEGGWHD
jgi:hypothetical protein